jgi:hypothetical protein
MAGVMDARMVVLTKIVGTTTSDHKASKAHIWSGNAI